MVSSLELSGQSGNGSDGAGSGGTFQSPGQRIVVGDEDV